MLGVRSRPRAIALLVLLPVAALALGVAAANRFAGPLPPRRLTISTGREDGAYFAFAVQYQRVLAEQGFALDIAPGPGSVETLRRLASGRAGAGFVQGGTAGAVDTTGLVALASVFYEPLWVFHRRALRVGTLADLRERRIGVGEPGSGTRTLALRLLAGNGIGAANASLLELPAAELEAALEDGRLDAALVVASPRAPVVHSLLGNPAIALMSERREAAYRSRYPFLTSVQVGEGMVDMARNLPSENRVLLAVVASLVVRDTIHPDWVRLLLFAANRVHRQAGQGDPAGPFPGEAHVELPLHEQAVRYLRSGPSWLEQRFPFWLAGILDRLLLLVLPVLTVLFPLFGVFLPMLDRRHRRRIARWYAALRDTEQRCAGASDGEIAAEIAALRRMRGEIEAVRGVPPLYLGDLYNLAMHVDQTLNRLERRARAGGEAAA